MMERGLLDFLNQETETLKEKALYKTERVISTPQQTTLKTLGQEKPLINFCANNYLGLSNHPMIIQAAHEALDKYGYGMSSVRFICGTQTIHKELEAKMAAFLKTEDAILYSSCFDANTGLFETILGEEDAVISDALNHASIIDGIRLCKAKRLRYLHNDMNDLEQKLKEASGSRFKLIVTDGVFSMEGAIANLTAIRSLAKQYQALLMIDDSHGVGVLGKAGRGSHEFCNIMEAVDILTGTFGKALGGASGGYTAGRKEIIAWLRQRSRPYLFSNALAPPIVATSIKALNLLAEMPELREALETNTAYFRQGLEKLGFNLIPGKHPIIPVMLGEAKLARDIAEDLFKEGIYVVSFSYPVVSEGKARIRVQISAAHTRAELDKALVAFEKVAKKHGMIS